MERRKILWLASWYPNRNDPFDGDFIQRHARAAAIHNDIHVIYVGATEQEEDLREEFNYVSGLTEQFIYFRKPKGILSALQRNHKWQSLSRKAVENYIRQNGMPSLFHVHVAWKSGLIAIWARKKFGLPFFLSEHSSLYGPTGEYETMSPIKRRLILGIFRRSEKLITVSRYLSAQVENKTGRRTDVILPNIVDTTLFFPKDEKYSRFTFIHVSNMVPLKNADLILRAFAQISQRKGLPPVQLVMVGNRDDKMVLLAGDMGLLNISVFFHGEMPYRAVAEEMQRAHCLVSYSDDETFSCVTAEALCSGLPVIASDRGALTELVGPDDGILLPREDHLLLARAMEEMLDKYDGFDREAIAVRSSRRFGYSAIASLFCSLYSGKAGDSTGA